jgi:hypothetical protein
MEYGGRVVFRAAVVFPVDLEAAIGVGDIFSREVVKRWMLYSCRKNS